MSPITEASFTEHYTKHYHGTLRFLLAKGVSRELAHDACQAAWTRAWEKREQFSGGSSVYTWVRVIAWRIFLSEKRRVPVEQLPKHFDAPIHSVAPHAAIDAQRVLKLCTVSERRILSTRYLRGLSNDEAAEALAVKPCNLKSHIFRITQRLRREVWVTPQTNRATIPD